MRFHSRPPNPLLLPPAKRKRAQYITKPAVWSTHKWVNTFEKDSGVLDNQNNVVHYNLSLRWTHLSSVGSWLKVKWGKVSLIDLDQLCDISGSSAVTFSLSLYSDLRVVKTGGQPLLKFILRYLSRHSRNFSPAEKYGEMEKIIRLYSTSTTHLTSFMVKKWFKK